MGRLNFGEAERYCQTTFNNSGSWYHLYTNGKETRSFLLDDDDFRFCVNLLARCAIVCHGMKIVAFAIMDNHIHIVVSGDMSIIENFFKSFRRGQWEKYVSVYHTGGHKRRFCSPRPRTSQGVVPVSGLLQV